MPYRYKEILADAAIITTTPFLIPLGAFSFSSRLYLLAFFSWLTPCFALFLTHISGVASSIFTDYRFSINIASSEKDYYYLLRRLLLCHL